MERWENYFEETVKGIVAVDDVKILNVGMSDIKFSSINGIVVAPATHMDGLAAQKRLIRIWGGVSYTRTIGRPEGWEVLKRFHMLYPDVIIVGSRESAIAYPGEIFVAKPLRSYARKPKAERIMNRHEFETFE